MIGSNIRKNRKAKKIKIKDLAQQIGISAAYLGNIERGIKTNISCDLLMKVCEALGVEPGDLLGTTKEVEPVAILELIICMEELAELQKEVSKYARGRSNKAAVIEEIADIIISLDKLKEIIGIMNNEIQEVLAEKIDRNHKRRKEGKFY